MRRLRRLLAAMLLALPAVSQAVSITGTEWIIHFNLPDQTASSTGTDEFTLRDLFINRLGALQSNQSAYLATYTWSGTNLTSGGSGPLMNAMEAALNRGALLHFVADKGVSLLDTPNGTSNSLAAMAARATNALVLVQDDSASGIMHDKLGLFDYGPTGRWAIAGSWNFTAGACTFQWNVMAEIRNDALYAAYSNEFAELLAGRFHDHAAKSHAHDGSLFRLPSSWTNDFVRFAPYPDGSAGGTNALTDITNVIGRAEGQIIFALNEVTRLQVATSLVSACDRGVEVLGIIPLSDATNPSSSLAVWQFMTNSLSYTTTNRVRLIPAYERAEGGTSDDGSEPDLVHAKWLVADPFGAHPVAVIGSANWTDSALASTSANDENLLFLHDAGIARALYAQFKRIARALNDRGDFFVTAVTATNLLFRPTDTNVYQVEMADAVTGAWSGATGVLTGSFSGVQANFTGTGTSRYYRVRRAN